MSDIADTPAFPCHTNPLPGKLANAPQGMTMRQYYKAAALSGLLSSELVNVEPGNVVHDCAVYADAMLAEDEQHAKK